MQCKVLCLWLMMAYETQPTLSLACQGLRNPGLCTTGEDALTLGVPASLVVGVAGVSDASLCGVAAPSAGSLKSVCCSFGSR